MEERDDCVWACTAWNDEVFSGHGYGFFASFVEAARGGDVAGFEDDRAEAGTFHDIECGPRPLDHRYECTAASAEIARWCVRRGAAYTA